jgi:glycosyltransferase involved in cell wall biosynthesis
LTIAGESPTKNVVLIDAGVLGLSQNPMGGIESKVVELLPPLASFCNVRAISTSISPTLREQLSPVSFMELKVPLLPIDTYPPSSIAQSRLLAILLVVFSVRAGFAVLRLRDWATVIHCHNKFSAIFPFLFGRIVGTRTIYTEHNLWPWIDDPVPSATKSLVRLFHKQFARIVLGYSDAIIALSHSIKKGIETNPWAKDRRIHVVPDSTHVSTISETTPGPPRGKLVLFVGRLEHVKNPELLLRAAPQVVAKFPDAHVTFLGGGSLEGSLKRLAKKLGMAEHVTFAGQVDQSAVSNFLERASVVVFASSTENYPSTALLEAMRLAKSIVASDVGDTSLLVQDGTSGLLFPRDSATGLAKAICRTLENPDLGRTLGRGAVSMVSNFSPRSIAEATARIYEDVPDSRDSTADMIAWQQPDVDPSNEREKRQLR